MPACPLAWPGYLRQISRLCPPPPNVPSTTVDLPVRFKPSMTSCKRTVLCILFLAIFASIIFKGISYPENLCLQRSLFVSKLLRQLFRLLFHDSFLMRPRTLGPNFHSLFHSHNCCCIFESNSV